MFLQVLCTDIRQIPDMELKFFNRIREFCISNRKTCSITFNETESNTIKEVEDGVDFTECPDYDPTERLSSKVKVPGILRHICFFILYSSRYHPTNSFVHLVITSHKPSFTNSFVLLVITSLKPSFTTMDQSTKSVCAYDARAKVLKKLLSADILVRKGIFSNTTYLYEKFLLYQA